MCLNRSSLGKGFDLCQGVYTGVTCSAYFDVSLFSASSASDGGNLANYDSQMVVEARQRGYVIAWYKPFYCRCAKWCI